MRKFEKITNQQWLKDTGLGTRPVPVATEHTGTMERTVLNMVDVYEEDIRLPRRATKKSAGYDIFSPVNISIMPHEAVRIPTGLKCQMEDDDVLFFIIRSSLAIKYGITTTNQVGVIDADYYNNPDNEGHMWICLRNDSDKEFKINVGDRISQAIFVKFGIVEDDLPIKEERVGGFGSTTEKK